MGPRMAPRKFAKVVSDLRVCNMISRVFVRMVS